MSKESLKGKKYSRAFNGQILIEPLSDAIMKVLKVWNKPNGDFDGMWFGYDVLLDDLRANGHEPAITQVKKEIKALAKAGKIELRPTYDSEYHLSGRGWFLI